MTDFKPLVVAHAKVVNDLHDTLHMRFRDRARSDSHRTAWKQAAQAFHAHRSEVDYLLDQIETAGDLTDPTLRAFTFDYLAVDPIYFRSGYEKERLLQRVKRLDLTEAEKTVLRDVILRRVKTKALREFRRFRQLIPQISNDAFLADLRALARSHDDGTRARARYALAILPDQGSEKVD